jgi:hypothetical protein
MIYVLSFIIPPTTSSPNHVDYSIHLSFVENGPVKTQFYTFVRYLGFKKLDRIFPLVKIVSVIPLVIPAIIFNK